MEVNAIVLAGGKNIRLGRNKTLEIIGGMSLIERVIDRLKPLTDQILVVASKEPFNLPDSVGVKILTDIYPDKGPLGGIYSGLLASQYLINIVVACDMPFLNTGLLRYLLGLSGNFDAVVPRLKDRMIEPLHAVYSRNCLGKIKKQLEYNQLKVHSFLKSVNVRYVEREEIQKYDPEFLSFFNINDQSDLDRAISLEAKYRI